MLIQLPVVGTVLAALIAAAIVSLISTPVIKSLAFKVGAVDVPKDNRRMHKHPIPRMGGLAIFLGFLLSVLVFYQPLTTQLRGMLLGAVTIVILGIVDDIYALPAKPKFLIQIVAALIAVMAGNRIDFLSNPNIFSGEPFWELRFVLKHVFIYAEIVLHVGLDLLNLFRLDSVRLVVVLVNVRVCVREQKHSVRLAIKGQFAESVSFLLDVHIHVPVIRLCPEPECRAVLYRFFYALFVQVNHFNGRLQRVI